MDKINKVETPMTHNMADNAEITRALIKNVLEQSLDIHKSIKKERARLNEIDYREDENNFSILGHLDLWSDMVAGIAVSIEKRGCPKHPFEAINLLEQKSIFRFTEFNKWFFSRDNDYLGVRLYVALIDYLCRLCIDYLNRCGKA